MSHPTDATPAPLEKRPPDDLPVEANSFWACDSFERVDLTPTFEATPALRHLGPLPVPRGRFPLMGFLATVYDQIAGHARDAAEKMESS